MPCSRSYLAASSRTPLWCSCSRRLTTTQHPVALALALSLGLTLGLTLGLALNLSLDFGQAFQTTQHLYLVMDFCAGGDLALHIRHASHGRLAEPTARFVAAELLLAVAHPARAP